MGCVRLLLSRVLAGTDALRAAAAAAAAGTVEFMVDKHGKHYFLEVNPRVQVR
jgi:pyruvate carboxylase